MHPFRHRKKQQWSGFIYRVRQILTRKETGLPVYIVGSLPMRRFMRDQLQKVSDSQTSVSKVGGRKVKRLALGQVQTKTGKSKAQKRGGTPSYQKKPAFARPEPGRPGSSKRFAYVSRRAAMAADEGWQAGDQVWHKNARGKLVPYL